SESNTCG
uniref:Cryptide Pep-10 n=2 Tax=Tityus TaxID=6886 RepID=CRY10_TITOB